MMKIINFTYILALLLSQTLVMAQEAHTTSFKVAYASLKTIPQESKTLIAKLNTSVAETTEIQDSTQKETLPQETKEKKKKASSSYFVLKMHQNNVAGFYPGILGGFSLNEKIGMTFYGVFWTNPAWGTATNGGDLLMEYGVGIDFKVFNKHLYLNPSIGFTSGKFISQSEENTIGDAIVPNIFALYNKGIFETEIYLSYYKALRKNGPNNNSYILNWILPGVKLNSHIATGIHYEQVVFTNAPAEMPTNSLYQTLGGYVRFTTNKGHSFRVAIAKNLEDKSPVSEQFYKVVASIPF